MPSPAAQPAPEPIATDSTAPQAPASATARLARHARASEGTPRRAADWRTLFRGGDSHTVLARLLQDDPLGLRTRVAARLAERAYLLDVDRALLRSLARTARAAATYDGDPPLERWLAEKIDEAFADLLAEDHEAERAGTPCDDRQLRALDALGRPLGLSALELRAACVSFNRLAATDRTAFHALVIRARSLDEIARERAESATETARAARRGLDALLQGAALRRAPPVADAASKRPTSPRSRP